MPCAIELPQREKTILWRMGREVHPTLQAKQGEELRLSQIFRLHSHCIKKPQTTVMDRMPQKHSPSSKCLCKACLQIPLDSSCHFSLNSLTSIVGISIDIAILSKNSMQSAKKLMLAKIEPEMPYPPSIWIYQHFGILSTNTCKKDNEIQP